MNRSKKHLFVLLLVLSILGLAIRLLVLWNSSTAFTYDQGRDLLDLREMMVLRKPRLIGASTSLHGVFYGPFWYWVAFPFYLISGGHPISTLIPLLLLSFFTPLIFFLLINDKQLGFILSSIYIFSNSFFSHSIVALNTNPIAFFTVLFVIILAKFYKEERKIFLWTAMFLAGTFFHFEPIIGVMLMPIFLISTFLFKKINLVLRNKRVFLVFFVPFVPQLIFEFRHNFLQTKTFLTLISGGGSSLTKAGGGFIFRIFDRLKVFKDVFLYQNGGNFLFAVFCLFLVSFLIFKLLTLKKVKKEEYYYLGMTCLISLGFIFVGFIIYPFALWPWYLGAVDALMVTIIGLGIYSLFVIKRSYSFLTVGILIVFLFLNIFKYLPLSFGQVFSPDPANLRTRLKVVDLIYEDSKGKGMNIFTFAPYVYDYPYQYLIWWRAKTKYKYLPEEYAYLPGQPKYVAAKDEADKLILSKKSECDYLIIEPFESQEKWFWEWRGHFSESKKTWIIGLTKVEKLCR